MRIGERVEILVNGHSGVIVEFVKGVGYEVYDKHDKVILKLAYSQVKSADTLIENILDNVLELVESPKEKAEIVSLFYNEYDVDVNYDDLDEATKRELEVLSDD